MRTTVLTVTAAALFVFASPSSAAPDRSASLSRETPSTSWTSEVGVGPYVGSRTLYEKTRCTEPFTCDTTLLRLTTPGDLMVNVTERQPGDVFDVLMYLYRSDASGSPGSEIKGRGQFAGSGDSLSAQRLSAGYYLVRVEWFEGVGDYTGKATLTPIRKR